MQPQADPDSVSAGWGCGGRRRRASRRSADVGWLSRSRRLCSSSWWQTIRAGRGRLARGTRCGGTLRRRAGLGKRWRGDQQCSGYDKRLHGQVSFCHRGWIGERAGCCLSRHFPDERTIRRSGGQSNRRSRHSATAGAPERPPIPSQPGAGCRIRGPLAPRAFIGTHVSNRCCPPGMAAAVSI